MKTLETPKTEAKPTDTNELKEAAKQDSAKQDLAIKTLKLTKIKAMLDNMHKEDVLYNVVKKKAKPKICDDGTAKIKTKFEPKTPAVLHTIKDNNTSKTSGDKANLFDAQQFQAKTEGTGQTEGTAWTKSTAKNQAVSTNQTQAGGN